MQRGRPMTTTCACKHTRGTDFFLHHSSSVKRNVSPSYRCRRLDGKSFPDDVPLCRWEEQTEPSLFGDQPTERGDTVGWQWNAMLENTLYDGVVSRIWNICARNGAWSECKQTGISEEASFIEKFFFAYLPYAKSSSHSIFLCERLQGKMLNSRGLLNCS